MSHQVGPHGEQPTVVYPIEALPGQPNISIVRIPLKDRVTLYFRYVGADSAQVQQLVLLKTRRANGGEGGYADCDDAEQENIAERAKEHSKKEDHPWAWTTTNVGAYIATGLTQPADLDLAIGLREDEIKELEDAGKALPPDIRAKLTDNNIQKGANERLKANRIAFSQQVEIEDRIRQAKQAMQAPRAQLNPATHAFLAGAAAREISEKKK